jgi:hypothetical protein
VDSRLFFPVGGAVLIAALLIYGQRRVQINQAVRVAIVGLWKLIVDPKTCRVAETFFVEASVLWFVFPVLDMIYEHKSVSDPLLMQSYLAAFIFFIAAVVLSHAGKEE